MVREGSSPRESSDRPGRGRTDLRESRGPWEPPLGTVFDQGHPNSRGTFGSVAHPRSSRVGYEKCLVTETVASPLTVSDGEENYLNDGPEGAVARGPFRQGVRGGALRVWPLLRVRLVRRPRLGAGDTGTRDRIRRDSTRTGGRPHTRRCPLAGVVRGSSFTKLYAERGLERPS